MTAGRVCLVVTELLGLVRNGGIATATSYLALALADAGYDVELAYCGWTEKMDRAWSDRLEEAGVSWWRLDRDDAGVSPAWMADSYRLRRQLSARSYDTVVFQDWQGLGYCSMVAKRAGLDFGRTRLLHIVHGPTDWLQEANRRLEFSIDERGMAVMERRSAELADAVIGPSRYLLDWMAAAGWQLPEEQHQIPYFTEGQVAELRGLPHPTYDDVPADEAATGGAPLAEIVFFGRLEPRKGVAIFARALNALDPRRLEGITVTFLGRPAVFSPDDVRAMLSDEVRRRAEVRFIGDLDSEQARAHLRRPGTLAVMPSTIDNSPCVIYECIEDRVAFLASGTGGIPELIGDGDTSPYLFSPDPASLAAALDRVLAAGTTPRPPRPAFSAASSLQQWRRLLDVPAAPAPVRVGEPPLVSVVVPHYEQPDLVRYTLDALDRQTYPSIELVMVDDGSTSEAARRSLDAFERFPWTRPFRLVRQENRYLGAARNTGVRHATGDLVAFVDDDDVPTDDFVELLVGAMSALDVDVVTCAVHAFRSETGPILPDDEDATFVFIGNQPELAAVLNPFGGAPGLYRKAAVEAVGGFHELHGVGYEDWHLFTRLSLAGYRLASIPEPLYRYRLRRTSMLRTMALYDGMVPIFAALARDLPDPLKPLPMLYRGLSERVFGLQRELDQLRSYTRGVEEELELLKRYQFLLEQRLGSSDRPA